MKPVNCYRMRAFSCTEPLEKQKSKPLKVPYEIYHDYIKPFEDGEWLTNLLNKYFSKEDK